MCLTPGERLPGRTLPSVLLFPFHCPLPNRFLAHFCLDFIIFDHMFNCIAFYYVILNVHWVSICSIYSTLFLGNLVVLQSVYHTLVHVWSLMGRVSEEAVSNGDFDIWTLKLTSKRRCRKFSLMRMGFKPTRAKHNGLTVHHLHHSTTSSFSAKSQVFTSTNPMNT